MKVVFPQCNDRRLDAGRFSFAFRVVLLTVLGATSAFGTAQIWDLGEGIAVGATSDGQVTCIRHGADLNKTAIWSVQHGFKPPAGCTPEMGKLSCVL